MDKAENKDIGGGSSNVETLVRFDTRLCFGVMNPLFTANSYGTGGAGLSENIVEPSLLETTPAVTKRYIATTKLIMLTIKVLKWLGS